MKTRDQQLLEEAYSSIYESKPIVVPAEVEPGWEDIPEREKSGRDCFCGSGKPFEECCGWGVKLGSLVYVMDVDECHWLDFSNLKDPYKSNWKELENKCGVLVGKKELPFLSMYTKATNPNYKPSPDDTETVYAIKRPDGKVFAVPHELIDREIPQDVLKKYKEEKLEIKVDKELNKEFDTSALKDF